MRRNAYLIEDEDGNTLGTFNSRQLKPHREAKLKPTAEINMMESSKVIKKISRWDINQFAKNIQLRRRPNEKEEGSKETLTMEEDNKETPTMEKKLTVIKTTDAENPGISKEGGERHLSRKKRSLISEKGMRHVSRLIKLISGRQPLQSLIGSVEGVETKILLDF